MYKWTPRNEPEVNRRDLKEGLRRSGACVGDQEALCKSVKTTNGDSFLNFQEFPDLLEY